MLKKGQIFYCKDYASYIILEYVSKKNNTVRYSFLQGGMRRKDEASLSNIEEWIDNKQIVKPKEMRQ